MTRIQSFLTSAALAATLSACGTEAAIETPEDGTPVTMDWSKGETFYLATSYRRTAVKTEENPVNMAAAFNGTAIPSFGESWTEDIIWTYQVVESNFVPSADDELFRYAATDTGIEALAVIKASLEPHGISETRDRASSRGAKALTSNWRRMASGSKSSSPIETSSPALRMTVSKERPANRRTRLALSASLVRSTPDSISTSMTSSSGDDCRHTAMT